MPEDVVNGLEDVKMINILSFILHAALLVLIVKGTGQKIRGANTFLLKDLVKNQIFNFSKNPFLVCSLAYDTQKNNIK